MGSGHPDRQQSNMPKARGLLGGRDLHGSPVPQPILQARGGGRLCPRYPDTRVVGAAYNPAERGCSAQPVSSCRLAPGWG